MDYNGNIIFKGDGNEYLKTFTVNKVELESSRLKFPFLKDVDSFAIN